MSNYLTNPALKTNAVNAVSNSENENIPISALSSQGCEPTNAFLQLFSNNSLLFTLPHVEIIEAELERNARMIQGYSGSLNPSAGVSGDGSPIVKPLNIRVLLDEGNEKANFYAINELFKALMSVDELRYYRYSHVFTREICVGRKASWSAETRSLNGAYNGVLEFLPSGNYWLDENNNQFFVIN